MCNSVFATQFHFECLKVSILIHTYTTKGDGRFQPSERYLHEYL